MTTGNQRQCAYAPFASTTMTGWLILFHHCGGNAWAGRGYELRRRLREGRLFAYSDFPSEVNYRYMRTSETEHKVRTRSGTQRTYVVAARKRVFLHPSPQCSHRSLSSVLEWNRPVQVFPSMKLQYVRISQLQQIVNQRWQVPLN